MTMLRIMQGEERMAHTESGRRIVIAFAAVYLIWGSTYLAIRFAIETIPPLLMAGIRFLIAGTVLYVIVRCFKGVAKPERYHWRGAVLVGGLMLLGGNGGVVWAEQRVPSGIAALLIATVPLWMALLDWLRPHGVSTTWRGIAGLVLGFAGAIVLVGPGELMGGERVDPIGAAVLLFASLSWAIGSMLSRSARLPASPLLATAMEMLGGGALLACVGLLMGEWARLDPSAMSTRSLLSVGYLIVFGSLVGFTAYIWLLRKTTLARASTYAFVNPVVAVILGWAVAGEAFTLRTLLATAVIVPGVWLIISARRSGAPQQGPERAPGEGAGLPAGERESFIPSRQAR
jgi:drug/metabolite transporter (DMT)-like permease